MSGDPELLFYRHNIHDLMEAQRQQSAQAVQRIESNQLLNTPTEDTVSKIVASFHFDIPVLHRDQAEADQREGQVPVSDYFSRDYDGGAGHPTAHRHYC
jgi:hypothetical protein